MRNIFKKELAVAVSENYKFYDTVYTVRLHGTTVAVFADHSGLYALVSRRFDTRSEAKKAYSQIRFTPERSRLLLEARKKHAAWAREGVFYPPEWKADMAGYSFI